MDIHIEDSEHTSFHFSWIDTGMCLLGPEVTLAFTLGLFPRRRLHCSPAALPPPRGPSGLTFYPSPWFDFAFPRWLTRSTFPWAYLPCLPSLESFQSLCPFFPWVKQLWGKQKVVHLYLWSWRRSIDTLDTRPSEMRLAGISSILWLAFSFFGGVLRSTQAYFSWCLNFFFHCLSFWY